MKPATNDSKIVAERFFYIIHCIANCIQIINASVFP